MGESFMEWKEVIEPWTDAVKQWECENTEKYIFPGDEKAVGEYQAKYKGTDYELQLHLPPHPFAGNPYAPIWVINLNPGYNKEADEADFKDPEGDGWKWSIAQLKGEIFCNYYLRLPDHGSGACNWWKTHLSICKNDISKADCFFSIDYFPYQSKSYQNPEGFDFESTKLFNKMIKWGIDRNVLFIILRKDVENKIENQIGLNQLKNRIYGINKQRTWISFGNLYLPESKEKNKKDRIEENKKFIDKFFQKHPHTTTCCTCGQEKCTCEWQLTKQKQ